jgi:hypothetical protein
MATRVLLGVGIAFRTGIAGRLPRGPCSDYRVAVKVSVVVAPLAGIAMEPRFKCAE